MPIGKGMFTREIFAKKSEFIVAIKKFVYLSSVNKPRIYDGTTHPLCMEA